MKKAQNVHGLNVFPETDIKRETITESNSSLFFFFSLNILIVFGKTMLTIGSQAL